MQTHVGQNRCHKCIAAQLILALELDSAHSHDAVTVQHFALVIDDQAAIRIAVKCHADIIAAVLDHLLQRFQMCRAAVCIDVGAVRLIVPDGSIQLELAE